MSKVPLGVSIEKYSPTEKIKTKEKSEELHMKRMITAQMLEEYETYLREEEKSGATIEKYMRDLKKLVQFTEGREVTKDLMIEFKESLLQTGLYKISSINTYLAAANGFLEYKGWYDARVKTYKMQREAFCPENKHLSREEYLHLVKTAKALGKARLAMVLQTICATGIRISELQFITVADVRRKTVEIHCKGKVRKILIPDNLQKELLYYIQKKGIKTGMVFQTAGGKAMDRSNIWREMKALCKEAKVDPDKGFPHNLRHLFAQCFYRIKQDIAKLADVLGHSSIETTRIYIRTTCGEHRKQLEMMGLVYRS